MREIKFRGKRVDNGGWVYGDLITKPIHHNCVILENGCINNSVLPETVGQYTGINDKNGKEIYEWDVVNHFFDTYLLCGCAHIVEHNNGAFGYRVQGGRFISYAENKQFKIAKTGRSVHIEVIGNIYENHELLK